MTQFLIRLGQMKHIDLAMPVFNCTIGLGYCAVQFACHDYLRDIFVAKLPSGCPEKISNHLRNLITETQDVCYKKGWCNFQNPIQMTDWPRGKIKWFASSTLQPITFGSTYYAPGLLIGLPSFYNYTKTDDIPDSAFEIKGIALMRSAHDQSQEETSEIKDEGIAIEAKSPSIFKVRKIERQSDEGSKYADTLILSDDAKRFSIAREMFYGDSYHSSFKASVLVISLIMASSVGRASVSAFNLRENRLTYRIAVYALSGFCSFLGFKRSRIALDQYYAKKADERARSLGGNYETGADEYYAKGARRRNLLGLK